MNRNDSPLIEALVAKAKLWFELDGELILGRGGALLLRGIDEYGSISQAVKALPEDE